MNKSLHFHPDMHGLKSRVAVHWLQFRLQNAHSVTFMYVHPKSTWLQHYVHMQFCGCAAKYT